MNRVIINGDDFGMSESCSRAIAQAMREGLITDTTTAANGAWFFPAVALARAEGFADRIGIHFNITEGEPLTDAIRRCPEFFADGALHKRRDPSRVLSDAEQEAVYRELTAQVERLKAAGVVITHADSHHYVHNDAPIAPIVLRVCREQGIGRVRLCRNLGKLTAAAVDAAEAYNCWLRGQGFVTARYFGKLREIGGETIPDGAELLAHPDYDRLGALIDRAGAQSGYPAGEPIADLRRTGRCELIRYTDLK